MSYDLQIWTVTEPDWEQIFEGLEGWQFSKESISIQGVSWVINAGPYLRVEPEDIPEEVFPILAGIQYLIEMNLEPTHAPKTAYDIIRRVAGRIAKESIGVILDPQEGVITTPRGVKRKLERKKNERISVLAFGWWFTETELKDPTGFNRFYTMLESYLPEALPRRYGKYSPPQFSLEKNGKDHFIEFLTNEELFVTWYPHYPVLNVNLGIFSGFGPRKQGYRSNHLNLTVDSMAWSQPGWDLALRRFWYEISNFVRPFYGEVRILNNYILRRGSILLDGISDEHPIKNGWWKGIPKDLGPAVVLGQRYADLWPKFVNRSDREDDHYFASVDDWVSGKTVKQLVGRVPRNIAQPPWRGDPNAYPQKWPFEHPFSE